MVLISGIEKNSLAERTGIKQGDFLISINGHEINDLLDYKFYIYEKNISLKIEREEGDIRRESTFDIKKAQYEETGLEFDSYMMDGKKSCKNSCIFCFVEQLPKNPKMRETLYFKDDDERLSFLYGNYITLTNLERKHIDRIIKMRITPINVSVHTTNPALRVKMMNNNRAGETLEYIRILCGAGIEVNSQIVLCKGINDGAELDSTLAELSELMPEMRSIAVVPAGLTRYRKELGLFPLEPFTGEECAKVIEQVDAAAQNNIKNHGCRGIYCSDEFYIKAGLSIPCGEYYEEYPQIENGVGMIRTLLDEFEETVSFIPSELTEQRRCSIACGATAYPYICQIANQTHEICNDFECKVYAVRNDFFGENITVTGLITGKDLINQLKGKDLGDMLFISRSMLRHDGDLFLDDTSVEDVEHELNIKVIVSENSAEDLVKNLLGVDF